MINGAVVNATTVDLKDDVVVGADLTVGGTTVSFEKTVNDVAAGTHALTVNAGGVTTFGGAVGDAVALASLTTDNGGVGLPGEVTAINGGSVRTTGSQTYNDDVTLGAATVLSSTGNGTITFNKTINNAVSLAVNTGGDEVFNGVIGGTTPLTSLTTDGAGTVGGQAHFNMTAPGGAHPAGVNAEGVAINDTAVFAVDGSTVVNPSVQTGAGGQTYHGSVTLNKDTVLVDVGGDNIAFVGAVDGGNSLTVNTSGSTTFGGAVGSTVALTSLMTDDSAAPTSQRGGVTHLNGGSVRTTGAQTYGDAVTLGANTVLSSTGSGTITFNAVNSDATPRTLTVNTSGRTIFGGPVGFGDDGVFHTGDDRPLAGLTTDSDAVLHVRPDAGNVTEINGGGVLLIPTGVQTYNDNVTFGGLSGAILDGAYLTFAGTVQIPPQYHITGSALLGSGSRIAGSLLALIGYSEIAVPVLNPFVYSADPNVDTSAIEGLCGPGCIWQSSLQVPFAAAEPGHRKKKFKVEEQVKWLADAATAAGQQ